MRSLFSLLIPLLLFVIAGPARAEITTPRSLFSVNGEPPEGLASETEVGLALTSGNTRSNRTAAKTQESYRLTEETFQAFARYLEANAEGLQNANNWAAGARYERRLFHHLGGFVGESVEGDRFAGFVQRYASDLGARRVLWVGGRSQAAAELGYRYQIENRFSGERIRSNIVRAYFETRYRFNPSFFGELSIEALPNIRQTEDWMANVDAALESTFTKTFSFKTTYSYRYDNRPAGPYKIDSALTTSVVAKF